MIINYIPLTQNSSTLCNVDDSRQAILSLKDQLATALAALLRSESDSEEELKLVAQTTLEVFTSAIDGREPLLSLSDVDAVPGISIDDYQWIS